ncbi:DEAD/DEAH box helicase [Novacetimonas pomaceti]|uniref:DNA2/NAM7 helicase-like C-terminal domain-containing protein n=1 Tax=Novacetimonas pomaceti TaxID=2021998 RepID=A0A318QC86_9PROT|nr:AAA domain-containing protein [Novacetimonas pomaceti]PYD75454.1 hypothetical protein CFR71_09435 [Novacetimonas pomaceti]
MTSETAAFSDILACWHKIEFFIPFDLRQVRERKSENQFSVFVHPDNPRLPNDYPPPRGKASLGANLFLGLFDKEEVRRVTSRLEAETEFSRLDREERNDEDDTPEPHGYPNATTCMAKIHLNAAGEPDFTSVEISTFPWAIGKALKYSLNALSWDAFEADRLRLQRMLANFSEERRHAANITDPTVPLPLAAGEIPHLIRIFGEWADFFPPRDLPAALLQLNYGKEKIRRDPAPDTETKPPAQEDDDDDDEKQEKLPEIGILNSFFLTDIERALATLKTGAIPPALRQYLTELSEGKRTDLGTDRGRAHIIDALHPRFMNSGRWISNPAHAMSLMQQFAINTAFSHLKDRGIFSVNGPPGTGKTTLLRDIFAENITRRARVLASLKSAGDAFTGSVEAESGEHKFNVRKLRPDLSGYEMVVTSYNNTAVENISKDLPQSAAIDLSPDEAFTYLRPVAHKLAAETRDGGFRALPPKEYPWGLITCTLGNSTNRSRFCDSVFFRKVPDDADETWSGNERPATIWQWIKGTSPASAQQNFRDAAKNFRNLDQQVSARLAGLEAFANLHASSGNGVLRQQLSEKEKQLQVAQARKKHCADTLAEARNALTRRNAELESLRAEQEQIDRLKPSLWKSLFNSKEKEQHSAATRENAQAQIRLGKEIRDLSQQVENDLTRDLQAATGACTDIQTTIKQIQGRLAQEEKELRACHEEFPDVTLFENARDLETDGLQRSGLWHDRKLNRLRSDLFKAALGLHESWLAAVMTSRTLHYFDTLAAISRHISNPGRYGSTPETVAAIWQNFFMIVPVVSTTFASFARQFHGVGPETLGWVFVDEAGQAMPQAAVGAIFRARRAVIIGDPLQIEPVFTLSAPLVKALCDLSPHTADGRCSPARASVQTLADAANPYGTHLNVRDGNPIWVGSPLRVHRRCLDPMFTIANRIAYDGKMIHGSADPAPGPDSSPFLGESAWFSVTGKVVGKQVVQEQVDYVVALIVACTSRDQKLPALYVVSPFKEIRQAIGKALRDPACWASHNMYPPRELRTWIGNRIGTVHTFQGKEEDTVIMVLGADETKRGSAQWAASKPNILNVAVTRAKRRFYMIGDRKLWGGLNYFGDAAHLLPQVNPHHVLDSLATMDQSA